MINQTNTKQHTPRMQLSRPRVVNPLAPRSGTYFISQGDGFVVRVETYSGAVAQARQWADHG